MTHRLAESRIRIAALLLAGTVFVWGCSDRSADEQAVSQAARQLAAVGSGGLSDSQHTYSSVAGQISGLDLNNAAADGTASGLLSQSLQGAGSLEANAAMRTERTLYAELPEMTRLYRRYAELMTTAASLEAFDASEDRRGYQAEAQELAAEAERVRAERAELADEIAGLESRIADLEAQSGDKRNRAAQMRLDTASATATVAARQAVEIRGLTREADALDMDASRLRGRIETLSPELNELDAEVAKLVEQRRLALEASEQLQAIESEWSERAVRTRAQAAEQAEKLDAMIRSLIDLRAERVAPASEAALQALARAVRSADEASRTNRASGQIAKASATRRIGELHQIRSQGHGRFASALESLASAAPALPRAAEYRQLAADERASEAEHRQLAVSAYQDAAAALRGTGLRGDEREGLDAAAEQIDGLIAAIQPESARPESTQPEGATDNDPDADDAAAADEDA